MLITHVRRLLRKIGYSGKSRNKNDEQYKRLNKQIIKKCTEAETKCLEEKYEEIGERC